jgi:hypothetical protein
MCLTPAHFALRWVIVLFADEHNLQDTWLLWDAIVAHRANASAFIRQLSVAHLLQVPLGKYEQVIEDIQNNREWNVPELIRVAQEKLAQPRKVRPNYVATYNVIVAIVVALVFFWMLRGRFKD